LIIHKFLVGLRPEAPIEKTGFRSVDVLTGAEASTTAGRLRRSPLTPTPYG
jgi:hypothetical protein